MTAEFATGHPEVFLALRRMWERLSHHTSVRMPTGGSAKATCSCGWYDIANPSDFSLTLKGTKRDKAFQKVSEAAEFHWKTVGI